MRIIYEPRGRALEYAPLAVSLYRWCSFKCTYCFVPALTKATEHGTPYPRKDAIKLLKADAAEMEAAGDKREILMSFTTDPYQPIESDYHLTATAIGIFQKHGLNFTILTKAGIPSLVNLERLQQSPELFRYGTTLTLWVPDDEVKYEAHAARWYDRVKALKVMHEHGIRTWVSCEPVIDPGQTRYLIAESLPYVDEFRIGALNHVDKTASDFEMAKFVKDVSYMLKFHNKPHIWKKDLQPYLEVPE